MTNNVVFLDVYCAIYTVGLLVILIYAFWYILHFVIKALSVDTIRTKDHFSLEFAIDLQ